ncbi:hypothetical protein COOONC_21193 [Cooperia oncophora]
MQLNKDGIFYGIEEALTLGLTVTELLRSITTCRPLFRNEYVLSREHAIGDGDAYVYRHFQNVHEVFGVENTRENALVELIAQSLYEPGFTQLRTVEQLVVTVSTLVLMVEDFGCLSFPSVSEKTSCIPVGFEDVRAGDGD